MGDEGEFQDRYDWTTRCGYDPAGNPGELSSGKRPTCYPFWVFSLIGAASRSPRRGRLRRSLDGPGSRATPATRRSSLTPRARRPMRWWYWTGASARQPRAHQGGALSRVHAGGFPRPIPWQPDDHWLL